MVQIQLEQALQLLCTSSCEYCGTGTLFIATVSSSQLTVIDDSAGNFVLDVEQLTMINSALPTLILLLLINETNSLRTRFADKSIFRQSLRQVQLHCTPITLLDTANVTCEDLSSSEVEEAAARLSAQSFFDDLRGTKAKVALSALIDTYYVEEMLQDGVLTKKQLIALAQGKRQLNFEMFYEMCSALNNLQDVFIASDNYDINKIAKQDEAKALFNNLRGEKSTVSVTALKSLYYFEEMLQDGAITSKQFTDITRRKRQLDFESFYEACSKLDDLTAAVESLEDDKIPVNKTGETETNSDTSLNPPSTTDDKSVLDPENQKQSEVDKQIQEEDLVERQLERDLEVKKEIKVDAIIRAHFMKLACSNNKVSLKNFKSWTVVEAMLADGVIDTNTVDSLSELLGYVENVTFDEFNQLVLLLDDATGMGLIQVIK